MRRDYKPSYERLSQFLIADHLQRSTNVRRTVVDGSRSNIYKLLWKRWTTEYIPQLQQHQKWTKVKRSFVPGDIMLIVDHSASQNYWEGYWGGCRQKRISADQHINRSKLRLSNNLCRLVTKLAFFRSLHGLEGCFNLNDFNLSGDSLRTPAGNLCPRHDLTKEVWIKIYHGFHARDGLCVRVWLASPPLCVHFALCSLIRGRRFPGFSGDCTPVTDRWI